MKILLLAASLRKDSFNKRLISLAADFISKKEHEVNLIDFRDFILPYYDGDVEASVGVPESAKRFAQLMVAADALVIAVPEYNFSIPGTLKNLIDWVSRIRPMPWAKQPICLLSASPALAGGSRGLLATRVPLEICGAYVYPQSFSLASADQAFNAKSQLKDVGLQNAFEGNLCDFLQFTQSFVV